MFKANVANKSFEISDKYIINQVRLEFTFRRQSSSFYTLCSEDNVDFSFEIQEYNLQTIVSHTITLAKDKPALYPIQQTNRRRGTWNAGLSGDDTNFLEAYTRLFCIEGCEPDITRDEFHLGYTIFVYKSSTNMQNTLSLERTGHNRLKIKFSQATSEALSVLVYCKLNWIMTINSSRVVTVE